MMNSGSFPNPLNHEVKTISYVPPPWKPYQILICDIYLYLTNLWQLPVYNVMGRFLESTLLPKDALILISCNFFCFIHIMSQDEGRYKMLPLLYAHK